MIELIADKENDNDIEPELELSQLGKTTGWLHGLLEQQTSSCGPTKDGKR